MRAKGNKKICSCCRKEKSRSCFHKNKYGSDGLCGCCKLCANQKLANYRDRKRSINPQHFNELAQLPNLRYASYKTKAKSSGRQFDLTFDQFMLFWQKPCYYCGDPIETIGLDRVNNNKGYYLGNILTCCGMCNRMKLNHNLLDFLNKCADISEYFFKRKKTLRGNVLLKEQLKPIDMFELGEIARLKREELNKKENDDE